MSKIGTVSPVKLIGYTQDDVKPGDRIYSNLQDAIYSIVSVQPVFIGKRLAFYKVTLEEMVNLEPPWKPENLYGYGIEDEELIDLGNSEGEYTGYTCKWCVNLDGSEQNNARLVTVSEALNTVLLEDDSSGHLITRNLSDGLGFVLGHISNYGADWTQRSNLSVLGKYYAVMHLDGATLKLRVYKNAAVLATLDLSLAPTSWTNTGATVYTVTMSKDGKYIFISNYGTTKQCALFQAIGTDPILLAEGNYSTYAVYDSFDDAHMGIYVDQCAAYVNCLETKAILVTAFSFTYIKTYDIDTKTLGASVEVNYDFGNSATLGWRGKQTLLNTFAAFIEVPTKNLLIYKNGALLQTLTLADLGLSSANYFSISFSPRGKYIFITGTLLASGNKGWVVLKGT